MPINLLDKLRNDPAFARSFRRAAAMKARPNNGSSTTTVGASGLVEDAISSAADPAVSSNSVTYAHTCTGSNLVLVVVVAWTASATRTVTGVTYNGVALTQVASARREVTFIDTSVSGVDIWYLINPATGTHNIIATVSAVGTFVWGGGISFTGAHQSSVVGTANTATGTSTAPSVAITSAVGEIVVGGVMARADSEGQLTSGDTQKWCSRETAGFNGATNNGATQVGAASVTMDWTSNLNDVWGATGVSIKPA